jgi:HSP90 family molecular chaperone
MVADTVEIDSLSYKEGSTPVHWTCDGGTDYEMSDGTRSTFGTTITLHINEDVLEFCNEYRIREIIEKYCSFMPYAIYLNKAAEQKKVDERNAKKQEELKGKDEEFVPETVKSLNDTNPLWNKAPSECTDDEYKEFYRKVFHDYKEPLFWIHLNMDYPFRLKGILYFPKISNQYESLEGTIKLYNNQVFIADNIKEVIPEFLMLLKGVIDCPDLPLNVSRSALQNDGFVTKISDNEGNVLAEFQPRMNEVISEESAHKMLYMLKAVVEGGTAGRLRYKYNISGDIAGKTGTTNNNSDAWFMGITPTLVSGCWVGGEDRDIHFTMTSMGQGAAGALPVWAYYMKRVYADKRLGYNENAVFDLPPGYNPCQNDESGLEDVPQEDMGEIFE